MSYLSCLFYRACWCITTIRVTLRMPYKKQVLLNLRKNMGSPPVFYEVRVAHLFSFLCCVVFFFFFFLLCLFSSYVLYVQYFM